MTLLASRPHWFHLLVMMVVAACLRFPFLGYLSLYGDEEHTALAVQAILTDGFPHMPSGMPYWRGVVYSYLAAGSAWLWGLDEWSIRFPSAVMGVLAVPALYGMARRYLGSIGGSLTAWLLVCSAWHVDLSREGRMYATFLTAALYAMWWFDRGFLGQRQRYRVLAVLAALMTIGSHELSVLVVGMWLVAAVYLFGRQSWGAWLGLVGIATGLLIVWKWMHQLTKIVSPLTSAAVSIGEAGILERILALFPFPPKMWMLTDLLARHPELWSLAAFMAVLVLWMSYAFWRRRELLDWRALVVGTVVTGFAVCNFFGLVLWSGFALLVWVGTSIWTMLRLRYVQTIGLLLTGVFGMWMMYALVVWRGGGEIPLTSTARILYLALKDALYFPAIHFLVYLEAFSVPAMLAVGGTVIWLLARHRGWYHAHRRTLVVLWFWVPLFVIGLTREWVALRYTLPMYPFFLMLAAWTLVSLAATGCMGIQRRWADRPLLLPRRCTFWLAGSLGLLLLLVPVRGIQHNLWAAWRMTTLDYGDPSPKIFHGYAFHPDHEGPGRYVRQRLGSSDLVVAMDVFEHAYYVGRVDYWLRPYAAAVSYCRKVNGELVDLYVGARLLTSPADLEALRERYRDRTIWLITSSEEPELVDELIPEYLQLCNCAEYVGRDGRTAVFRLPPSPWPSR